MWYQIIDNKLNSYADYQFAEDCLETDIITMGELELHRNKVIVVNDVLALKPNYEEEEREKEAERISHLKMTKRVCALMLQQLGIPYSQLKAEIDKDEQAQLEWDLCVELERSNPLVNIIGEKFGLTSEQIDQMFKYANGEVESLEVE